jgi:hypothetical protein
MMENQQFGQTTDSHFLTSNPSNVIGHPHNMQSAPVSVRLRLNQEQKVLIEKER